MVGLVTAYWMGLNAAESAQASRDMWEIASRATRRHIPAPVDDRPALIDQIHTLQAQLQEVIADRDRLCALVNTNYQAWFEERALRNEAEGLLAIAMMEPKKDERDPWGDLD